MQIRASLLQSLRLFLSLSGLFITWQLACLVTNTYSPVVVVLSGSMKPAFDRGDLLFLYNPPNVPYAIGDVTVYKIPGKDVPIVHRVMETHVRNVSLPTEQLLLTKGDNNSEDDIVLYEGLRWIERKHVVGKVWGFLPYVGYCTILLNSSPWLKTAILGGLVLLGVAQG